MADIPSGDYSHLHRSLFGPLGTTDLRTSLVHDYKPLHVSDLRNNNINLSDRMDYLSAKTSTIEGRTGADSNPEQPDMRVEPQDIKPYLIHNNNNNNNTSNNNNNSAPSTPPTPMSIAEAQMQEAKIFGSKAEAQLHNQLHMREAKPYKCSQCSKAFANSSYLSQHTRIHLGIKPYRCEICQRKFTQLSHLQQHIRTHTGDKPYKCRHPGCSKAFSQLSNLQSHSRCHQTDKPYKCNSCYKCFTDEASLLEHIPKHKESKHLKTHICQFCGKSYTQETYLAKHLQKHAERAEKQQQQRPTASSLGGLASILPRNLSLNNSAAAATGGATTDHPYWPKVSPDSAAATSLAEAMQQNQGEYFSMNNNNNVDPLHLHRNALLEHHRAMNGGASPDDVEDLVISGRQSNLSAQHQQQQQQQLQNHQQLGQQQSQQQHPQSSPASSNNNNNIGEGPPSSYDIKTSSAFTPINVAMSPHLNSLAAHHHPHHHHAQLAQRPSYLYDTISFGQNVKTMAGHQNAVGSAAGPGVGASAAFPNQLISLHQIRSYTHQANAAAMGGLMAGEHLLGINVGGVGGKEKSS